MKTKLALAALLGLGLLACGSITTEHSLLGKQKKAYTGEVKIVMEGQKAPEGIQEIAIIQVAAYGNQAEMPNSIGALKTRAAQLGCNIVVNVRIDRGSAMSTTGVCGYLE